MNPVKVRNVLIGTGIPKICVPIAGITREDILKAALEIKKHRADIAEWRGDWYADIFDGYKTGNMLKDLRDVLGDIPLLFTFRTSKEGGEKEIGGEVYVKLNQAAANSGFVDLIDVEAFTGENAVRSMANTAHACGVKVIVSNHDFRKTPDKAELFSRLIMMHKLDADILKIAVMPQNKMDVLTLLAATAEMSDKYPDRPIITMSMAGMGAVSRLCGEIFGSAVTFGTIGKASAPGQLEAEALREVLKLLHKSL